MITSFGKFCRKLRIDNGELLKDMANKLEVTPSYLSAVENGKRNVPSNWSNQLSQIYSLSTVQATELQQFAQESQKVIKIDFDKFNKEDKSILMALAKELQGLQPSDKNKIKEILNKRYSEKMYEQDAK